MEYTRTAIRATKLLKRMRRCEMSIAFISKCRENKVIPQFCKIGEKVRRSLQVSKKEILNLETKKLNAEEKCHKNKIFQLQSELNTVFEELKNNLNNVTAFNTLKTKLMEKV